MSDSAILEYDTLIIRIPVFMTLWRNLRCKSYEHNNLN